MGFLHSLYLEGLQQPYSWSTRLFRGLQCRFPYPFLYHSERGPGRNRRQHIRISCLEFWTWFPGGSVSKEFICKAGDCNAWECRFHPWVRKIPWRRKWQPNSSIQAAAHRITSRSRLSDLNLHQDSLHRWKLAYKIWEFSMVILLCGGKKRSDPQRKKNEAKAQWNIEVKWR